MQLLVAGGDRVDAGKTTFSTGLIEYIDATGYKPRAGNNYWHDHDDVRRAVDASRLYGNDAHRLVRASSIAGPPERINPVHRLWQPVPGTGTGLLNQTDRAFLVDRVGEEFVVNGTRSLPDPVRKGLPLSDATTVTSLSKLNDVMQQRHLPALQALAGELADANRTVVESYGDIARPLQSFEPDAVAVVEPGRARIYDGGRYTRACTVVSGGPGVGQLEERVGSVVDMIDERATVALPALDGQAQSDPATIAGAYEPAYDALLSTAPDDN
ncbi:ATPase [Halobacteriales archaeon QS_4_62_28]|nr:MAG: ATPase [Halobacteriales archaeon QS_4_62_28]